MKVLCERCKKEIASAEVVLTQADVDAGKTVESVRAAKAVSKVAPSAEVVKTQAQVDTENADKNKPVEQAPADQEPAKEAKPKKTKKKK